MPLKVSACYNSVLEQHPDLTPVASLLLALLLCHLSVVSELIPQTTPKSLQKIHLQAVARLEVQLLGVTPRAIESWFLYDRARHRDSCPHAINTEPRKQQRSELVTARTKCT
jgi:hypothetical protein